MHRQAEAIGNGFVGHSLHHTPQHIYFPFTQNFLPLKGSCIGLFGSELSLLQHFPFKNRYGRDKHAVFHIAMYNQILLAIKYVEKHRIQQVVVFPFRVVLNDDVLQFSQFHLHLAMIACKGGDVILFRAPTLYQSFHISKHRLVFILHVQTYFAHILIEEFQNKKRHLIFTRTVDGLNQLPTDGRQVKIQEIGMRPASNSPSTRSVRKRFLPPSAETFHLW